MIIKYILFIYKINIFSQYSIINCIINIGIFRIIYKYNIQTFQV